MVIVYANKSKEILSKINLEFDDIKVFNEFSLSIEVGKINCIVGPSGCGKTSILNLLSGFIKSFTGEVNTSNEKIGYIFQEDRLLPWETVYQNIRLVKDIEDKPMIMELLQALDLSDFADKYPHQLSGGMRQRCSIGRGFYYHGSLLLMDEPFKSLDYDLRLNLVRYLGNLWEANRQTVIFVTHDIDEALLLGHKIIVLSKRPTTIMETYKLESPIKKRKILHDEHINTRSKIINHMSSN